MVAAVNAPNPNSLLATLAPHRPIISFAHAMWTNQPKLRMRAASAPKPPAVIGSAESMTKTPEDTSMTKPIYTKYGDQGETGLLYGGRVSKANPRTEAYGTVDEAVSALGLAKALSENNFVRETIDGLQRELFTVGAELATDPADRDKLLKHFSVVTSKMTELLERSIDTIAAQVKLPREFIIPGGSPASAAIDIARSTLRRAERRAVALSDASQLHSPELLRYLNRASDLLFMLARYQDAT